MAAQQPYHRNFFPHTSLRTAFFLPSPCEVCSKELFLEKTSLAGSHRCWPQRALAGVLRALRSIDAALLPVQSHARMRCGPASQPPPWEQPRTARPSAGEGGAAWRHPARACFASPAVVGRVCHTPRSPVAGCALLPCGPSRARTRDRRRRLPDAGTVSAGLTRPRRRTPARHPPGSAGRPRSSYIPVRSFRPARGCQYNAGP